MHDFNRIIFQFTGCVRSPRTRASKLQDADTIIFENIRPMTSISPTKISNTAVNSLLCLHIFEEMGFSGLDLDARVGPLAAAVAVVLVAVI